MENSKNQKNVAIILTDIQLHVVEPRKPLLAGRVIEKSQRNNKPDRWFKKFSPKIEKYGELTLPILEGSDLSEYIKKLKAEGKRFRIFIPKSGLMVYAGKDTVEYVEAQKRRAFDKAGN